LGLFFVTRQLDSESKTNRIVFIPKTKEEEDLSKNFKKLCNRDNLEGHDALLEAFQLFFKKHNWDFGGNCQTTLQHRFPLPYLKAKSKSESCRWHSLAVSSQGKEEGLYCVRKRRNVNVQFCESCKRFEAKA